MKYVLAYTGFIVLIVALTVLKITVASAFTAGAKSIGGIGTFPQGGKVLSTGRGNNLLKCDGGNGPMINDPAPGSDAKYYFYPYGKGAAPGAGDWVLGNYSKNITKCYYDFKYYRQYIPVYEATLFGKSGSGSSLFGKLK